MTSHKMLAVSLATAAEAGLWAGFDDVAAGGWE